MNLVLILPKVQGQQTPCSLSPLFTPQPDNTKFISIITVWVDAIFFICKWYGRAKEIIGIEISIMRTPLQFPNNTYKN